jgi:recombination protein RecT
MGNLPARTDQTGNGVALYSNATLNDLVHKNKAAIKNIAAENVDLSRLYRMILQCVAQTPALQKCSELSVLRALMQAAEVGLEPGGALGLAYLVPYKEDCQYIIGYRGLVELARRSGQVRTVEAFCVYEGDLFEYEQGLAPILRHKPGFMERTPDKITHVYAVARYKDGSSQADVMTKADVERIRMRSAARDNGPWKTDYEEMAKKTVVRRLCKYLPRSVQLEKALTMDARNDLASSDMAIPMVSQPEDNPLDVDFTDEAQSDTPQKQMEALTR